MTTTSRFFHCALLIFLMLATRYGYAHGPDQSNLFLQIEDDAVRGRVEIAIKDLNAVLQLSMPEDSSVTVEDVEPYLQQIQDYVRQRVSLSMATKSGPPPFTDVSILDVSFARMVQLHFAYENLPEEPREIEVQYSIVFDVRPDHRGMLVIENYWKTGTMNNEGMVSGVFEPGKEMQTLDLSDSSTLRGFMAMVELGTHHIWIGIDHILFLLALLLPAVMYRESAGWQPVAGFRPALIHVIKVVTVFTVAHTITLSLAALNTVTLSSRIVESIIAISIAIAALNIVMPVFKGRIWWIVFTFGLFHGFGFASVLGEIGIPESYLVHSLLGFNIGVELGQVAIVVAVFPVLYVLRRVPQYASMFLPAAATALIVVSLYWFTERAFEVDLPAGAIVYRVFGLDA